MNQRTRLAIALRLYLATNEISQKELALAWGCSESAVCRLLSGEALLSADTMLRVFGWMLESGK